MGGSKRISLGPTQPIRCGSLLLLFALAKGMLPCGPGWSPNNEAADMLLYCSLASVNTHFLFVA